MSMPERLHQSFTSKAPTFKPDPLPLPPGNIFLRYITTLAIAQLERRHPSVVAEERWPSDRVIRAATAPAMTTVAGWAAELAQTIVREALPALGPASAGGQLLKEGLVLSFNGAGAISAPGFVAAAGAGGFVAEGAPIPVRQLASAAVLLVANKLATIAVLTREMIESSNAEQLVGDAFSRSLGAALDAVLFDSNPASAIRPAGLRSGIATSAPSASTDTFGAAFEDVHTLLDALAPVGGNGPYALIMSPGRAASIELAFDAPDNCNILGSSLLPNDIIAIAPAAVATAIGTATEIDTGRAATLHMDTVPQPVGSVAPHRSLWQTDSVALKGRFPVSWALRDPRGVAWLTPSWK